MLPEVHELKLDNGFRALLVERNNLPVVATALWCKVGARDEHTGQSGLAHFLEHMMFKGTDRYAKGEIDLLTSKMGGSNNAFTDHDSTVYHFSMPSSEWETVLEIEASRMRGCALDPDEFAAEKNVVLEELAMGVDDPWRALFQETETLSYDQHPYHKPVIGYREELERVSVDGMRSFYESHYGANRSFLVVVGAIDRGRTESKIQELFGRQPIAPERPPVLSESRRPGARRAVIYAPGRVVRIACAFPTCSVGERDDLTIDVLAHILGHGKTSRLERRLVIDEPLATQVGVHNDVRLDPGLLWVYAELHPDVDAEQGERAIRETIDELLANGVTDEELRRAKTQIRAAYLFEDEAVLGTALKIGRFEGSTAAGYPMLADVAGIYEQTSAEEVRTVANRYLSADSGAICWSLPQSRNARNGGGS